MLILLVTVFNALFAPCTTVQVEEACYGRDVTFPELIHPLFYKEPLYFTPSNGGRRITLMENGKAKDPRIKVKGLYLRLTDINRKDEGVYAKSLNGKSSDVFQLKILDCAQRINQYYMHEWSYWIPGNTHYVEYTPIDNQDVTVILWNITNLQSNDQRRGNVKNNIWKISGVTQADNGFYNFRQRDGTLESRILLTVEENTRYFDPKVDERLFIGNPWTGGNWTVTFKQDTEDEHVTVIKDGQLFRNRKFSMRITIINNGFEIYPVLSMDCGTFEFRDKQGNLALSVQVEVIKESHHTVTYTVVGVVALLLGICSCCCCCCKKRCCKKDKSAAVATEGPAVINHDKSAPTAPASVVYYHGANQPTGPSYSYQPYASVCPPQPVYPPAFIGPAAVSTEPQPSQPITAVYPPQPTNINPPQPEPSLYPPLSEVGYPTIQGSGAAPTFSSDILSSDAEPRFQMKGIYFPTTPPLSSDPPTSDVYNSEKLNFL